jgi:hypothetical protein
LFTTNSPAQAGTSSRSRRRALTATAGLLLALGGTVLAAPTASATTCDSKLHYLCGAAKNRTGRTMSVTESLGSGSDYCDVWNWEGGPGSSWLHARCAQETIGNGTLGGNGTGRDVDAFTFANQGYHERFSRVGSWHWRVRGVWTKIRDGEIADCGIGDGHEIWCTVLWQA